MLKLTNINYGLSRPMIPEKRIIRRIQSGGCAIHCQDCSISQLCIPFTLNEHELDQLDNIIERKKPIQKGQTLFKAGDELKSLYAIRSGTIKSYTITEQGDEQITGFHLDRWKSRRCTLCIARFRAYRHQGKGLEFIM